MSIRRMYLSDLRGVVHLYQDANIFTNKKAIDDWTRKGLESYPQLSLIYEQNGEIIGAISAVLGNQRRAIINDISIQRKYRGRGIGRKLMIKIIGAITKENINQITLWVHWSNARAIPFYYSFGFRIKKCTRTYHINGVPNGEDIIYLEKNI